MTSSAREILLSAYVERRALLVRVFTASLHDQAVAEDLIQDLYVKIMDVEGDYTIENPTGFLFRMANNLNLNRMRSDGSSRNRERAWHDTQHTKIGDDLVDETPNAETDIVNRQQRDQLRDAVDRLPEKTRAILRLHKFEGMSQPQVAAQLGISISSVEKHLSSALRHLVVHFKTSP